MLGTGIRGISRQPQFSMISIVYTCLSLVYEAKVKCKRQRAACDSIQIAKRKVHLAQK